MPGQAILPSQAAAAAVAVAGQSAAAALQLPSAGQNSIPGSQVVLWGQLAADSAHAWFGHTNGVMGFSQTRTAAHLCSPAHWPFSQAAVEAAGQASSVAQSAAVLAQTPLEHVTGVVPEHVDAMA